MSAEQEAREMLERMGWDDAQSLTAGDVVELANLIAEVRLLRRLVGKCTQCSVARARARRP